jgi:hypothetical protein
LTAPPAFADRKSREQHPKMLSLPTMMGINVEKAL